MLYTVCFTQIMCSVDSLDPGHCPWTSILEFLKIGQVLFSPCSLHIYIYIYVCVYVYNIWATTYAQCVEWTCAEAPLHNLTPVSSRFDVARPSLRPPPGCRLPIDIPSLLGHSRNCPIWQTQPHRELPALAAHKFS